jgi:hypothetical protein
MDALERLVAAGWGELERHQAVAHAGLQQLSSAALLRAHEAMFAPLGALVRRGQEEGAFRRDAPAAWLLSTCFALMHAYRDEVDAGRLGADGAIPMLQATLRRVFQADTAPSEASASASGEPGGAV